MLVERKFNWKVVVSMLENRNGEGKLERERGKSECMTLR